MYGKRARFSKHSCSPNSRVLWFVWLDATYASFLYMRREKLRLAKKSQCIRRGKKTLQSHHWYGAAKLRTALSSSIHKRIVPSRPFPQHQSLKWCSQLHINIPFLLPKSELTVCQLDAPVLTMPGMPLTVDLYNDHHRLNALMLYIAHLKSILK